MGPVTEKAPAFLPQEQTQGAKHKIRFITAAALFDGHDVSINIMRRILQAQGAEVIHLGHNRSAEEVVTAAIQEDVQAIAVSSYQGGHMEFFTYMYDLLQQKGAGHIQIYGGGGGVIVPDEIQELHRYGIKQIFSPEDGRKLGLVGMIRNMIHESDFSTLEYLDLQKLQELTSDDHRNIAGLITLAENRCEANSQKNASKIAKEIKKLKADTLFAKLETRAQAQREKLCAPIIGLTGTGGSGKSSLTDELLLRFKTDFPEARIAVLSVDPSKRKTGGALLGDRIRMNTLKDKRIYMRSLATRVGGSEISLALRDAIRVVQAAGFEFIFVETSGIGQGSSAVVDLVDIPLYVMTKEYGAASQLEKIDMLDYAALVAVNKFERQGSEDALRDVKKQMWRNQGAPESSSPDDMPAYPTIAARFNDPGVNAFYQALLEKISKLQNTKRESTHFTRLPAGTKLEKESIIPNQRGRYLSEVSESLRSYHSWVEEQASIASSLYTSFQVLTDFNAAPSARLQAYSAQELEAKNKTSFLNDLRKHYNQVLAELDPSCLKLLQKYPELSKSLRDPENVYTVRNKEIRVQNYTESLSHQKIPKIALPRFSDWGDLLSWLLRENVPGEFPFTAGVFPYKRQGEDPTRMFAGEGPPAQTNQRFHLLAEGQPAARLSTAFDSVTLYGEDPHERPDIYGKIGDAGVSICSVEDMEILYGGFDLSSPKTSVSMTINGPAPIILAFFMNAAIRQQVRKNLMESGLLKAARGGEEAWNDPRNFDQDWEEIRKLLDDQHYQAIRQETLKVVRGTVQADILKEDQAQNTCIFSTEFALKMMGDVQQYFIDHGVRNYYSVSISGYHIAEAGANPITQVAFTLANGFTYVEYYLSRGMKIDDFAPNLSFFFSNGIDPEYAVIGRVARRIWAVALKKLYRANERSQKLKYHIQTSGRSLHAMEIDFNDIRTTLQALYAIYDNCNSLHTNAYDEAITTPTEESVRRALAIQLIINRELGLAKNENPLQGSFVIEELTQLVEEAILSEFDRITERGGVLGAMETQYQRGKIQEESMYYEGLKFSGELPVIGVNTFLRSQPENASIQEVELRRATQNQKDEQIKRLRDFQTRHQTENPTALEKLRKVALEGGNIFEALIETVESSSLGQISHTLYQVGGEYRRNM